MSSARQQFFSPLSTPLWMMCKTPGTTARRTPIDLNDAESHIQGIRNESIYITVFWHSKKMEQKTFFKLEHGPGLNVAV